MGSKIVLPFIASNLTSGSKRRYAADVDGIASTLLREASAAPVVTTGSAVVTKQLPLALNHYEMVLSGVSFSTGFLEDEFLGQPLIYVPDTNIVVVGCEIDLTVTKSGSLAAAQDMSIALGTSATTDSTIGGGFPDSETDVIIAEFFTDDVAAHTWQASSAERLGGAPWATVARKSTAAGFNASINVNAAFPGNVGTGTITIAGTLRLFYFDLFGPAA